MTRGHLGRVVFIGLVCGLLSIAQAEPQDGAMDACTEHLRVIGSALAAYQRDHHQLPDQLSDLFPKYVTDKSIFHCPADSTPGDPARDFAHRDPKMPLSYSYECSADESHGLPCPLGTYPKSDIPGKDGGWGTCRQVAEREAYFFGDRVPVVRCFHHKTEESDEAKVLNLDRSGKVYCSHGVWEDEPECLAFVLDRASIDLLGGAQRFKDNWDISRLQQYGYGKLDNTEYPLQPLKGKLTSFADLLSASISSFPADQYRMLNCMAARYYNAAGQHTKAIESVSRAMRLGMKLGDFAPEKNAESNEGEMLILADAYRGLGQREQELAIISLLHNALPKVGFFKQRLIEIHQACGATEVASKWQDELDPGRRLVTQSAAEFKLPTPEGKSLSLTELRNGKKCVLLSFFFCGCGPCRAEAPHLQELYRELKDRGLLVISVDAGDSPANVHEFAEHFKLTFPVLVGGEHHDGDVFDAYHVSAFPSNFLLDASGKIVWHDSGYGDETPNQLRQELAKLGLK